MHGRLDVDEKIREVTGYGKSGHVLTYNIANLGGFTQLVTERHPEACFVFQRSTPGEPLTNVFRRVATVNDFHTIPYVSSPEDVEAEGLYRSASFIKEYPEANAVLADRNLLFTRISAFSNNLNAYMNANRGTESTRKYVLPDYERGLLDSLILKHRRLRNENSRDALIVETIEDNILGILQANNTVYLSLKEAVDLMKSHSDNKPAMLEGLDVLQNNVKDLRATMSEYAVSQDITAQTFSRVNSGVDTLQSIADSGAMDEDIYNAMQAEFKKMKAQVNAHGTPVPVLSQATINTFSKNILPSAARIEKMVLSDFIDNTTVEQLLQIVTDFGESINSAITENKEKVRELSDAIEFRKGELQVIESQMKQIRPSIDITNPESAWYFTVNLEV